jgi:Bacterial PH domain
MYWILANKLEIYSFSWDRDSELKLYTRNYWDLGKVNLDFRKGKADIIAIQKFVAAMVMKNHQDAQTYFDSFGAPVNASKALVFGNILDWVNNDSIPEDPVLYEQKLRSEPPLLLSDETVSKVFKAGRDKYIYTNKRLLHIDVKGWTGKRIGYKSYPNKWMSAFSVETAGHLDNDSETNIFTDCAAGAVEQEYLVKTFDIMNMQEYLTQRMFFDEDFVKEEEDILVSI